MAGLAEYLDSLPAGVPDDTDRRRHEQTDTIRYFDKMDRVEALKSTISGQIRTGSSAEGPLYTAIRVIEILTSDTAWAAELTEILDKRYGDLAQESLFVNRATEIAGRLESDRAQYVERTLKRTQASLRACERLQRLLSAAESELQAMNIELADPCGRTDTDNEN